MTNKPVSNVAASVRSRLLNLSQALGTDYNALLAQYAIERFLFRLSKSELVDRFVLKGAMLFRVWAADLHRPTKDLDLLGFGDASPDTVAAAKLHSGPSSVVRGPVRSPLRGRTSGTGQPRGPHRAPR